MGKRATRQYVAGPAEQALLDKTLLIEMVEINLAIFEDLRLDLTIDNIEPSVPIENSNITVTFTLTNQFGTKPTSGVVMGTGIEAEGGLKRITNLKPTKS